MKIRDMAKCLEEFEQLCRAFLKSKNIVDKEGVPPFYIRILADLEDYLNTVSTSHGTLHLFRVSNRHVGCLMWNINITVLFCFLALGGQRGQEEDEQKQCESSQHSASEDPQVQQRLRVWNSCLQRGNFRQLSPIQGFWSILLLPWHLFSYLQIAMCGDSYICCIQL